MCHISPNYMDNTGTPWAPSWPIPVTPIPQYPFPHYPEPISPNYPAEVETVETIEEYDKEGNLIKRTTTTTSPKRLITWSSTGASSDKVLLNEEDE